MRYAYPPYSYSGGSDHVVRGRLEVVAVGWISAAHPPFFRTHGTLKEKMPVHEVIEKLLRNELRINPMK